MSALPIDPPSDSRPRAVARILVADDEPSMRELLSIVLRREGYEVLLAASGAEAVRVLERRHVDLLISDLRMPDMSGVDVLRAGKQADPELSAIVVTAYASTETAVEAMRLGACDYLTKPFDVDELKILVRNTLERGRLRQENVLLKRALGEVHAFSNIIGRSPKMLSVFRLIETIAPTTSTVLVTGESGTGKELAARAIHFNSLRREKPFVALNCGALPETLLESELFGHMRGAFTGAAVNKKGLLEAAQQGTVFLDEISEMSPMMQVKLLRVLQERRFRRVGGTEEIEADIRIIAATNRDLPKEIAEGRFREDLYLPDQRDSRAPAAAARTWRGHHDARGALRRQVREADGEGRHRDLARRARTGGGVPLARQHPRTGERDGAGRGPRADADGPARQPAGLRCSTSDARRSRR